MLRSVQNGSLTLADYERLVQSLYEPGADVARINAVLTSCQRSPQGWHFADKLLESKHANARFFGALTFTVKINTDWNTLSAEDAAALLDRLLTWLIRLVVAGEGPLVIRKLCSSLVAYFLRPSISWDECLRHLLCCLVAGGVVNHEDLPRYDSSIWLMTALNDLQLKTLLWLSTSLVEEVGKTNSNSDQTHHCHEKLAIDLDDAVALLHRVLDDPTASQDAVAEAVRCSQAWVKYAHRSSLVNASSKTLESLRSLAPSLLRRLAIAESFEVAVDFFTDVLMDFPTFFDVHAYSSLATFLASDTSRNCVKELRAGEFGGDAQDYSRLLFAYGDATVQNLARNVLNEPSDHILNQLLSLLNVEGYAGEEIQICSQAIEFWQTYTEFVTDSIFSAGERQEPWMQDAKGYIAKALQQNWMKIRYPKPHVADLWDSEIKADFRALRQDFTDLVQASFAILGFAAFEHFAQLTVNSLGSQEWFDLEASLLGLNALSDAVADDASTDGILSKIFGSTLFDNMMNPTMAVPIQTQVTAMSAITNYTSFFERQAEFLPNMLSFLFTFLGHTTLAREAAKAISSACSSCRKHLISRIDEFLQAYQPYSQADPSVREKIIGAIAMIVQALPSDEAKLAPLSMLLAYVDRDVAACTEATSAGRTDDAVSSGLCALRCLTSIGNALQVPDEDVIDLEAEGSSLNAWDLPNAKVLQTQVTHILHAVTGSLSWNNDIIEAGCQVLRTGYKETTPGLLVLPPEVTVTFVVWAFTSGLSFTGMTYVIEMATAMLRRRQDASNTAMANAALNIWCQVLVLIQGLMSHSLDEPEIVASCIGLAEKMIPHHFKPFFSPSDHESLHCFFNLSVQSLVKAEMMPKRAAASFWAVFVQKHELSDNIGGQVEAVMDQYGPQLCHALIHNISGEAARSDLDTISLPLKKLIFAQSRTKRWLSEALNSTSFVSDKISSTEKRVWLEKVMVLRGGAATNKAVKEFWMSCRGTNMDYAS